MDFIESRNGGTCREAQERKRENGESYSQQAAYERKHQTFGEELTRQARAGGSQRLPQSHFFFANGGAGQQKAGDIGAGNQQHETNGAEQNEKRGPNAAHEIVRRRSHIQGVLAGVGVARKLLGVALIDGVELTLGAGQGFAGLQAREDEKKPGAGAQLHRPQAKDVEDARNPDVRLGLLKRKTKCRREDADDGGGFTVERHGAAEN